MTIPMAMMVALAGAAASASSNLGEPDAQARPYILFGLGATQYGTITVNVVGDARQYSWIGQGERRPSPTSLPPP